LLINDLNRLDGKLGLILDDYHLISNPAIHTALAFLLEHLPPQLHLIIASRSDPPLSLSRWRVRSELNELRASDLRFTAVETTQFLHQALEKPLAEAATELLVQRTEGWAAGLRLAALSLRGLDAAATAQFVTNFGGTNRHIFTYLVEEVLLRQPNFVQQFLLQTTFLDRLTASLCDAVIELKNCSLESDILAQSPISSPSSQGILDYLATHNLFLVPLDQTGQWFRYHPLFAETLQARLHETQPDLIPELHRRAASWYAANNYTEQAVRHALAAHDSDMAAELIDGAANRLWLQGHLGVLLTWLKALPEGTFLTHLHLHLIYAWLLFLHDCWAEASQHVHLAGQQIASLPPDNPETVQHRGRWAAIQGAMAAHRQEAASAIAWMESALENLPPDDIHWRQVAMLGLGLAQLAEGQTRSAITTLHQTALACEQVDDLYLAFASWWHQMEASWAQGNLREVAACLRRLEMLAGHDEGNWLALPANAAIGWGMLAYEGNDLVRAEQLLTTALPQIWPGGQPRVVFQAYLTLARLAQAQGNPDTMHQYLNTAGQLVHRFKLTAEQWLLAATTARLLLAEGHLPEAYWQLENQGIGPESPPDYRHEMGLLTLVRIYLAEECPDEALTILARLLPPAELAGRDGSLLEICLLQALALTQRHQQNSALACLNRALALAEPEQYGRIFMNEGRPLAQLLRQVTPHTPYVAHLLNQMNESPFSETLLDPLTSRELEILTFVADGASNQAIANQLFISLGTVKGHLNHILGKLDAHNRTEAVARGRELGLL
jgi:LuxR family maltose regulon positive regulatory protein